MPFEQLTPRPFTAGSIQNYAPIASGVYGISNSREWIFIGESDNIQGTLLAHLRDSSASLMQHDPAGFVFEVCDRARRPARQDRLIVEYGPVCNPRATQFL